MPLFYNATNMNGTPANVLALPRLITVAQGSIVRLKKDVNGVPQYATETSDLKWVLANLDPVAIEAQAKLYASGPAATPQLILDLEFKQQNQNQYMADSCKLSVALIDMIRAGYPVGDIGFFATFPMSDYYSGQDSYKLAMGVDGAGSAMAGQITNLIGRGANGYNELNSLPPWMHMRMNNSRMKRDLAGRCRIACVRCYSDVTPYDHGGWCRYADAGIDEARLTGCPRIIAMTQPYYTGGPLKGQLIPEAIRIAQYTFLTACGVDQAIWTPSGVPFDNAIVPALQKIGVVV